METGRRSMTGDLIGQFFRTRAGDGSFAAFVRKEGALGCRGELLSSPLAGPLGVRSKNPRKR